MVLTHGSNWRSLLQDHIWQCGIQHNGITFVLEIHWNILHKRWECYVCSNTGQTRSADLFKTQGLSFALNEHEQAKEKALKFSDEWLTIYNKEEKVDGGTLFIG